MARPQGFEPSTVARNALAGCALLGGAIPSDSSPYHLGERTLPRTPLKSGVQVWNGCGVQKHQKTKWRARRDLNPRLSAPEADALSAELRARKP